MQTIRLTIACLIALLAIPTSVPLALAQGQPRANPQEASPPEQPQGRVPINVFTMAGIPNESGQVVWPVAFRIMPRSEQTSQLLEQINAQFVAAVTQRAEEGRAERRLLRMLGTSLSQLRRMVFENKAYLGQGPYEDARLFVLKLQAAERLLE